MRETDTEHKFFWFSVGGTAGQIIGRSIEEVVRTRIFERLQPHLARTLEGLVEHFDATFIDPAGRERHLRTTYQPDFDQYHNVKGLFAFSTDETDRLQAATEVRESEARFRAVFERTALGIALMDSDGATLDSNPRFQSIVGRTEHDLLGTSRSELLHPEYVPEDQEKMRRLNQLEYSDYVCEQRLLHIDDTHKRVNSIVSAVPDNNDQILFRVAMVEDITDKKRMSEEFRYRASPIPYLV